MTTTEGHISAFSNVGPLLLEFPPWNLTLCWKSLIFNGVVPQSLIDITMGVQFSASGKDICKMFTAAVKWQQDWKQSKIPAIKDWWNKLKAVKTMLSPGLSGSVGWSTIPCTKRLLVGSLVRAHNQVAGSIPGQGACGRQLINVFHINLSPFLSPRKKINKYILGWFKKMLPT